MTDEIYDMIEIAYRIPELGGGGAVIAPRLMKLANNVPAGSCIVETGPWMGSTTAFLAIGSLMNHNRPTIHSYDIWVVGEAFVTKARKYNGLYFNIGESVKKRWKYNLKPFPAHIVGHQGNAYREDPPEEPIGLFVDDCTSGREKLEKLFANFEEHFIDGCRIVMMDYYFILARPDGKEYHETVEYFRERVDSFGEPKRIGKTPAALFRYRR